MDSTFGGSGPPMNEGVCASEEIYLFRLIDFLLNHGWRFLGSMWNGKRYEIKIENSDTGKELPPFKSDRPYWRASDANGNMF